MLSTAPRSEATGPPRGKAAILYSLAAIHFLSVHVLPGQWLLRIDWDEMRYNVRRLHSCCVERCGDCTPCPFAISSSWLTCWTCIIVWTRSSLTVCIGGWWPIQHHKTEAIKGWMGSNICIEKLIDVAVEVLLAVMWYAQVRTRHVAGLATCTCNTAATVTFVRSCTGEVSLKNYRCCEVHCFLTHISAPASAQLQPFDCMNNVYRWQQLLGAVQIVHNP